jgi:hypothetical protein
MGLLEFLSPNSISGVGLYLAGFLLTLYLYNYVYRLDEEK